ncbi:MAG: hypothetical protein DMF62_09610 [Acidobacteria bacterium]|nr:MAG: hypothetical protein DMF62_09610 [Acidobacteriota bacterium]
MRSFLDRYEDAMRQTWIVGVIGSTVVLLAAIREISGFFVAVSANHLEFSSQVVQIEIPGIALAIFIGLLTILRATLLSFSQQRKYVLSTLTWTFLIATLFGYIWLVSPSEPECAAKICFGIYDQRVLTNFLAIAGALFLPVSAVRSGVTAVYAVSKYRFK